MKSASGMDPFAGLALEMREQARRILPPQWRLGRVTAAGPGVLRIRAGGLDLVWWSFPIAELFSVALCALFLRRVYLREIKPMTLPEKEKCA